LFAVEAGLFFDYTCWHEALLKIFVGFPFDWVGEDVVVDALVVGLVADDVVMEAALEDGDARGVAEDVDVFR
jgi:hypothetical protein